MKKLLLLLSLCSLISTANAQEAKIQQQIELHQFSTSGWDITTHPIHKTPPVEIAIPQVYYSPATSTISFIGETPDLYFSYYIIDPGNNILITSTLCLNSGEEERVSLATLAPGAYTIVLSVNGRYYCGEFEL